MEETAFVELDQAAVAGAEGTAWALTQHALSEDQDTSLTCLGDHPCYSTLSASSPFDAFPPPPPIDLKPEPALFVLHPIPASPPQQTSLCSARSEEASSARTMLVEAGKGRKRAPRIAKKDVVVAVVGGIKKEEIADLRGTTAARSRKMTEEERRVMLHKRRLRNRASAARSREKRSRTLNDLSAEVEELMKKAATLAEQARNAVEEARNLKARNVLLSKENELLKAELRI